MRYLLALVLLLLLPLLPGCTKDGNLPSGISDNIPTVYSDVQRGSAYVENAQAVVEKAKPESSATGKALLNVASDQQQKAIDTLKIAQDGAVKAEKERQDVEKKFASVAADNDKLTKSWGHRLQVWVTWGFWIIVALFAFHALGGIVGAMVPGPIGAILSVSAAVVNPMAWIQTLRDNYYFRKVVPAAAAKAAAVAAPTSVANLDLNGNPIPPAA